MVCENFQPVTFRFFAERLSAGFPSAAEGYEDSPLNLHDLLVRNPAATFFYRVTGDDLRDEHIRDGSIIVIDRSLKPQRGKLVLIESNGEVVITKFREGVPQHVCGVVTSVILRM